MTKKIVYTATRKNAVKEFENTIDKLWKLHAAFEDILQNTEVCLDNIEDGFGRKKVSLALENEYEKLKKIFDDGIDLGEDFGICIDNFVDVKRD